MLDTPFPELHEFVAPADPAPATKPSAITTHIATAQTEVTKLDAIEAGLKAIETAHPKNVIVGAIDTPAGYKAAETAWRAYRNPRLEVERARKAAKAPVLALGKAIDAFAEGLETRLREGESHYGGQIEIEDARRAAVKAEAERVEAERIAKHQAGIAKIRAYLTRCQEPGMTADRISIGIGMLEPVAFPVALWEEFAVPAASAQCETLDAMRALHMQVSEREAAAARIEAQRVENERIAAEQAERQRKLDEQAAALKAEADRLQAIKDAAEAEAARALAEQRAESDRLEALAEAQRNQQAEQAERELLAITLRNSAEAAENLREAVASGAVTPEHGDRFGELIASLTADVVIDQAQIGTPAPMTPPPLTPAIATEPTLMLGEINTRIAPLSITGAGLSSLGFEPAGRRKAALLFHESDWPAIRAALIGRLTNTKENFPC